MRKAARPRRTDEEIDIDILRIIEKNDGELKRTPIGNRAEINYLTVLDHTDRLEREKLITRDSHGYYSITKNGVDIIREKALDRREQTEVLMIARRIGEKSPIQDMSTGLGGFDAQNGRKCFFCGEREGSHKTTHKETCEWMRLRELFEMGE
jgi:predicted transcriptional regulator